MNHNIKKYNFEIGINTKIGKGVNIHHVNGIVIGMELR
jgi:serine O-acetyltransferase